MKRKKTPWFIILPAIALMIAVGVGVAIKLLSPENAMPAKAAAPKQYPNPYGRSESGKPSKYMGKLDGPKFTPTVTQHTGTAEDFSRELKDTVDDGGASEIDAIKSDAKNL